MTIVKILKIVIISFAVRDKPLRSSRKYSADLAKKTQCIYVCRRAATARFLRRKHTMKASNGVTLGAPKIYLGGTLGAAVTWVALCGFTPSAFAAGSVGFAAADMKDTREEIARLNEERRAKVVHSRNFNSESCDAGKIWVAHGHDNLVVNGKLDPAEVEDYTCEFEKILVATEEVLPTWSLSCFGKGGVRHSFGYDTNYNGRLDSDEVNPKLVKTICKEVVDSRSDHQAKRPYWKSFPM